MKTFYKTFLFLFLNALFLIFAVGIPLDNSFAQSPLVKQWDYRFGGTLEDALFTLQQTTDGGYILGGASYSGISGDKTQNTWGALDYWIVKTDALGNKQWDKNFGGTDDDELFSLKQTADGGYILGGSSMSGISGDKTQINWGYWDCWIVKIDSLGNKQWDKDFGGTGYDQLFSLQQTADGGYVLGATSMSGISGDKTQNTWGSWDYWIVKIDSLGNKQWDKDFGGSAWDKGFPIQQTMDGGYILGGSSSSGVSGDKTQNSWGYNDYWIIKTDSLGNKQWDKDFGGSDNEELYSLQQTTDGGYILAGLSQSGISGNKTQPSWGHNDYWIVKTDSLGNKQWDKDFGGTDFEDEFGNITQTTDGGYLIAACSYSIMSGNKTENNLGVEQSWIVKTDSSGNIQWDKTIFTPGHDEYGFAVQTNDGCFVFANFSDGGIGGYKTQISWGARDYWIIKFCDTTSTTSITQLSNAQLPFSIYPNPSNGIFQITFSGINFSKVLNFGKVSCEVINTLGQKVYHAPLQASPRWEEEPSALSLDLSFLPKGMYVLKISESNIVMSKIFIID